MTKSSSEHVADFLLDLLPGLLPKPVDSAAKAAVGTFKGQLDTLLKQPRLRKELLEAARRAESDFRERAKKELGNDDLTQAVASFPLFDRELFQSTLKSLPEHLNEEYLAGHLRNYIADDWKGKFFADDLRKGAAIYMECLRIQLLRVDGFAELVTQLETLRTGKRTEQILDIVKELLELVKILFERMAIQTNVVTTLFTIPPPVRDFTGREAQIEKLKAEFSRGAVITGVSGGGGVGKTELARKLAYELADNYPAARMSIDLLGTTENPLAPEEVMQRLLSPLRPNQKLPNDPDQLKGLYQQTISEQKVLILFDNVANAAQIRPLIPQNLSAAIITSRNYFSLTEFGFNPLRLDAFSPEDALAFLRKTVSKLREARDEDLLFLADLCGKLPLALRVATSILSDRTDWGLDNLIIHLQDERFRLKKLKRDNDTDLDVEATISLSYNFLPEDIKVSFLFLGMFSEWFWHHSVSSIWDIQDIEEVDRKIGFLLNRNLIMHSQTLTRTIESEDIFTLNVYALHDLTRLFTRQQLMGDLEKLRLAVERHANYFINLTREANNKDSEEKLHGYFAASEIFSILPDLLLAYTRIFYGSEISISQQIIDDWLAKFNHECMNYLEYFPAGPRIFILQNMLDGKDISTSSNDSGKETKESLPEDEKYYIPKDVFHLWKLGAAYTDGGEYDIAISTLRKSLELLEGHSDPVYQQEKMKFVVGRITGFLGNAYLLSGNVEKARGCYETQLKMAIDSGDLEDESVAYGSIANIYCIQKDYVSSIRYYRKQLKISLDLLHKCAIIGACDMKRSNT